MRDPAATQDAPTTDRAGRHRAPNSERTGSRVLAPRVGCLPTGTSSEEAAMKDAPAEPTGTTTGPAKTAGTRTHGRTSSTATPSAGATTTRTPSASWPEPGST